LATLTLPPPPPLLPLLLFWPSVVSDAGSGGQVLLDSVSFGLVKDRLEELGQVRALLQLFNWAAGWQYSWISHVWVVKVYNNRNSSRTWPSSSSLSFIIHTWLILLYCQRARQQRMVFSNNKSSPRCGLLLLLCNTIGCYLDCWQYSRISQVWVVKDMPEELRQVCALLWLPKPLAAVLNVAVQQDSPCVVCNGALYVLRQMLRHKAHAHAARFVCPIPCSNPVPAASSAVGHLSLIVVLDGVCMCRLAIPAMQEAAGSLAGAHHAAGWHASSSEQAPAQAPCVTLIVHAACAPSYCDS
jgi:hypothetical protein